MKPYLRGHLFLFDERRDPAYGAAVGARLLLMAIALEAVRVAAVIWLPPSVPLWLFLPALLGVGLLAVPAVVRLRFSDIGLSQA